MTDEAATYRETRTVSLGDIEVTYDRVGSGPAVVLIHGLAEDRRSWRNMQDSLTGVTTYAYDLRGHGDTDLGRPEASLIQLRDDLLGFLETVTGPAICVGFSLGGTIVLAAAAQRPDLVTRIVVIGTSSVVGRGAAKFYTDRVELFRGNDSAEQRTIMRADTAAALHNPASDVDRVTEARLSAIGDGQGYIDACLAMASLNESPLTPALSAIGTNITVTVVGADNDAFCPKKAAEILLGAIAHASYEEISEAGHLMLVDQPQQAEALLQRLVDR